MGDGEHLAGVETTDSGTDVSRRKFVKQSGKALYIAPILTVLATAPASAQINSLPPPPPGGAPPPPAPNR